MARTVDVVVVGAGIGGLCAAKTFKELAPHTTLLVLESRKSPGGVWAHEAFFEGVSTNNFFGSYEYSDFPMDERYGMRRHQHIPGTVVTKYLYDYAYHFDILKFCEFNTTVVEAQKTSRGWTLTTKKTGIDGTVADDLIYCEKLIMCTGHFSKANAVSYAGQDEFGKPVFNHTLLREEGPSLAKNPEVKTVTVVGASKTGYDAVYYFASQGKKVQWIVRASGSGSIWMYAPWLVLGSIHVLFEHLAATRLFSWFSPCIWGDFDGFGWIRKLLHSTQLGMYIVELFWSFADQQTVEVNGYRKDQAMKDLEPRSSIFWNPRSAILNYPTDIHDFVRKGQVSVIKKDISHLSKSGRIHLTDESTLQTDGLMVITGWEYGQPLKFTPEGIDAAIGIPTSNSSPEETARWAQLNKQADSEILHQFPILGRPQTGHTPGRYSMTPFRLYRGIASPGLTEQGDHSLAFINVVHCTYNFILAETQSLWTFAYLNDKISIKREDVYWQTALFSRFGKLRYPLGFSTWWPEFIFDLNPYADMLLTDLGLKFRRKNNLLREIFEGYTVHDYKGIAREWAELHSR